MPGIWLERILPRHGVCSRTDARTLIRAGRVRVDGRLERDPRAEVLPESVRITLDGAPLKPPARRYLVLNKPCGYLTTARDERGRPTIFDLIGRDRPYLFPVGRLDKDTSGLILMTNDGRFAETIADPRHHVPKTYRVEVDGQVTDQQLARLAGGILLDDGPTRPASCRRLRGAGGNGRFDLTLTEGRNRQVRRMVEAVGGRVVALERRAIGPLRLTGLAPGASRDLSPTEISALMRSGAHRRP